MVETRAEIRLPTSELRDDIPFFTKVLGMRMDMIFPADDPTVAVFSGHGLRLRIEKGAPEPPGTIRICTQDPDGFADGVRALTAPNGTRVEIVDLTPPMVVPETVHSLVVRRLADQAPWIIGRAGMQYRDLIPDRLGGSIIASHIRIPDGGPVPDMVHYHTVGFQLIYCYRGWVDLVYEDQGPPFRLYAGNCVIQPPEIRHRVLFASDNIEVIEIGVPAEHITTIDHQMDLPNDVYAPDRLFQGQRFVHHQKDSAVWRAHRLPGFQSRDTAIARNTQYVAGVEVVRRADIRADIHSEICPDKDAVKDTVKGRDQDWDKDRDQDTDKRTDVIPTLYRHDADILFSFVLDGEMTLHPEGHAPLPLRPGDAFVIPPGTCVGYGDASDDLEFLEVSLPGRFTTTLL